MATLLNTPSGVTATGLPVARFLTHAHVADSVGAILRDGIAAGLFVLAVVVICLAMGA